MAINATLLTYPEATLTPQDFSIMLDKISVIPSGIMYGCAGTVQDQSTVKFAEGWVAVRGRLVKIDEGTVSFVLPASGTATYYVYVKVDLSNSVLPASIVSLTEAPSDETSTFNYTNGKAYCLLATVTMSPIQITQVLEPTPSVPSDIRNALASTVVDVTLASGSWSNGQYTISGLGEKVTATTFQEIAPAINITADQLKAFQKANIQDGGQGAGYIVLKAFGTVPTVNIPIRVICRGFI